MKYINVRGCNGSGKTTLLRGLATGPVCKVIHVTVPDHRPIPVTYLPGGMAIIGDYSPAASGMTTAGLDRIKTQAAAKAVIEAVGKDKDIVVVLFEGVVVSTIYGPWQEWSRANGGMVWAYLDTPLDVCLARIQARNGGKPIKDDQVADKHRTIERTKDKARRDGERVLELPWENAHETLTRFIEGAYS